MSFLELPSNSECSYMIHRLAVWMSMFLGACKVYAFATCNSYVQQQEGHQLKDVYPGYLRGNESRLMCPILLHAYIIRVILFRIHVRRNFIISVLESMLPDNLPPKWSQTV